MSTPRDNVDNLRDLDDGLSIAKGGTGGTTESGARTALGLEIGTDVEAFDAAIAKTDENQTFTEAQRSAITALSDAANISIDFNKRLFSVTLAGNRTLDNPTNIVVGQSGEIQVDQDATGTRTLSYGTYYESDGGVLPVLTTTASATDILVYKVLSTTRIYITVRKDIK